jgi:RimJ/RimL family protein N-acetyltransferase
MAVAAQTQKLPILDRTLDYLCRKGKFADKAPQVESIFTTGNRSFRLETLSLRTLDAALILLNNVFHDQSEERATLAFPGCLIVHSDYCLLRAMGNALLRLNGVSKLQYWVLLDETTNGVVGTVGVYDYTKDAKEASWGGWMAVDPGYRRLGLANHLVDLALGKIKADGKQWIRLYTSTLPGEAAAQHLYDKLGLEIFKRESIPGTEYEFLYRQLRLR